MKIIKRLLGLPFVLGIILVSELYRIPSMLYYFLRYGGEFLTYKQKDEHLYIADLMNKLDEKLK